MQSLGNLQHFALAPWMVPVAALAAGLLTALILRSLAKPLRLGASAVVAVAVGVVLFLRLHGSPASAAVSASNPAPSSTTPQQSYEETLFKTHPAYKTLADREPAGWQESHRDIAEVLEVHGADDPDRKAGLDTVFQRLDTKLMHGAATAGDAPLLAYLAAVSTLTKALQHDTPQQCAEAALGSADLDALPKDDAPLFQSAQAALVDAYLDGGRTPVPPPEKTREQALMRRAVDPGAHPFTAAELAHFVNRAQQPPDVTCALTIKFYDNVQAMPPADGAALLRAVLRTR